MLGSLLLGLSQLVLNHHLPLINQSVSLVKNLTEKMFV